VEIVGLRLTNRSSVFNPSTYYSINLGNKNDPIYNIISNKVHRSKM